MKKLIAGVVVGGLAGVFGSNYIEDKIDERNCAEGRWECSHNMTRAADIRGTEYLREEIDRLDALLDLEDPSEAEGCASWLTTRFASVTADMRLYEEFAFQNVVHDEYSSVFQPLSRSEISTVLENLPYENPAFFECPVPDAFQERMRAVIPAYVEGIPFMSRDM